MKTYVSLLRGVNVGKKQMKMAALKELYQSLDMHKVVTYVQSGNVVFDSMLESIEDLTDLLEKRIEAVFGFSAEVLIRTEVEMKLLLQSNPFLGSEGVDPSKLHITFLSAIPTKTAIQALLPFKSEPDEFRIIGKEVHLHCPDGYGKTKLSNTFFEKKLGVTATTRNWRTANMLLDLIHESQATPS